MWWWNAVIQKEKSETGNVDVTIADSGIGVRIH